MKKEHFLWQLYTIEQDITKTSDDLEADKRSRQDILQDLDHLNDQKREKNKELHRYSKEVALCEKKISDKRSRLDKYVSCLKSFC